MQSSFTNRFPWLVSCLLTVAFAIAAGPVVAQVVSVKDPWVRSTVPRQKATAAYMEITAGRASRLLEASSPVAGVVEIHEMRMDKDVMRMRAVPALDLPAGQPVALEPGGYHVMLMDLKGQVKDGDTVPVTLVVEGKDGKRQNIEIKASARNPNAPAMKHGDGHSAHKH